MTDKKDPLYPLTPRPGSILGRLKDWTDEEIKIARESFPVVSFPRAFPKSDEDASKDDSD